MATSTVTTRFSQRLPQFITMFFSFTMVGYFRLFADTFHLSTGPSFDFRNGSQNLVLISFVVTLFWVVTAWVGYSMLIERYPYSMDLSRFLFDVARFSLLNFQMNFAFLAAKIESFHFYIFSIGLWHAMMMGWYLTRTGKAPDEGRQREARRDATSHGIRFATYLILGLLYYFAVATRADQPDAQTLRYVLALLTFAILTVWNIRRIAEIKTRAQAEA